MSAAAVRFHTITAAFSAALLCCSYAFAQAPDAAREGYSPAQDLQIVDCLAPGQVRVVGGRTYITPRRPGRMTASECRTLGGEYLDYDRATYESALAVWLGEAEQGDPEAQTIVGEIYERGLGGEPNFQAAAQWYRRAAEQDFTRAQFNLGALYEQGLGVGQDRMEALNWYRRSSGLSEDSLIFQSAARKEADGLRTELEGQMRQKDQQIEFISRQLAQLQSDVEQQQRDAADVELEISSLQALRDQVASSRSEDAGVLSAIPRFERVAVEPGSFDEREQDNYRRRDFGSYFALIIGVQNYSAEGIDDLSSPLRDLERARRVLEQTYGFDVITLADPSQAQVMAAVNQLNEDLDEDDNLLIYFVGHGARLQSGTRETGYWLPTNALPAPNDTFWVANEFVSRHLGRISARRVLIVSDASYAGMLGDDPGYVMVGEGRYSDDYIDWKKPKRSRLVLVSGSDDPVVDIQDGNHSVFARALLEELENNDQVLTAPELFLKVRRRLRDSSTSMSSEEEPALKVIKDAGHEVGDFFFVPARG